MREMEEARGGDHKGRQNAISLSDTEPRPAAGRGGP